MIINFIILIIIKQYIMSLSSRLKQSNSLRDLKPVTLMPSLDRPTMESNLENDDEEEVKIDFDVQTIIESLSGNDNDEDSWKSVLFVSDFELTDDVRVKLERHIKITDYNHDLFLNRSLTYMYEQSISNIWINITNDSGRKWVAKNITKTPKFKVVLTYSNKKSKWVDQLSKYGDLILKKKDIEDASFLTVSELFSELRDSAMTISKPLGNCLERLFKQHQKKKTTITK
jgi:hypothetical protein